jgi:BMFP domain-containing protein YqiC
MLSVLRRKIDGGNVAALRAQFQSSISSIVPFWNSMGASDHDMAAELAAAQSYVNATPLSKALPIFGESRPNTGEMFGLWCFLFKSVDLDPLRLSELLADFNSANGTSLSVADLGKLDLAFSAGPSGLRSTSPLDPRASFGVLDLSFESVYHNPNDDAIAELKDRVVALEGRATDLEKRATDLENRMDSVESELDAINQALLPNGDIQKSLTNLGKSIEAAGTVASQARADLASLGKQADTLNAKLAELETAVNKHLP